MTWISINSPGCPHPVLTLGPSLCGQVLLRPFVCFPGTISISAESTFSLLHVPDFKFWVHTLSISHNCLVSATMHLDKQHVMSLTQLAPPPQPATCSPVQHISSPSWSMNDNVFRTSNLQNIPKWKWQKVTATSLISHQCCSDDRSSSPSHSGPERNTGRTFYNDWSHVFLICRLFMLCPRCTNMHILGSQAYRHGPSQQLDSTRFARI